MRATLNIDSIFAESLEDNRNEQLGETASSSSMFGFDSSWSTVRRMQALDAVDLDRVFADLELVRVGDTKVPILVGKLAGRTLNDLKDVWV